MRNQSDDHAGSSGRTVPGAASFGNLLKEYRVRAGLSQEQLAERAKISAAAIGALERGVRRAPYNSTVSLLTHALDLDADETAALEAARRGARTSREPSGVPWRSNLPAEFSTFIGREHDVANVKELIVNHRLVTLVGSGGVGKTRIALRAAADLLDASGRGVWFVDFAPLTDASLIPNAIASALSVQESLNRVILETLITFLKDTHLLLIFDNCEHLIEGVARVAEALLQSCPRVHVLATSREAIGIPGEHAYRIPSLNLPPQEKLRAITTDDALGYDAVALFVERARAADNRFALTQRLVPAVAEICRRLDGIALAIELAAARVNTISAAALASKLHERFLVLTGGSRTALPRHKTMRALIAWSYDLLDSREQALFRHLAIFTGGFTLELATSLCAQHEGIAEDDVLGLIASLVDKSLVVCETGAGDVTRYRLLESTRQYAFDKLQENGEDGAIARAHALAMLAFVEPYDTASNILADSVWTAELKPEIENWRAALTWSLAAQGDVRIGQRLAGSLRHFWAYYAVEGLHWVRSVLRTCDDTTPASVRAKLQLAEADNTLNNSLYKDTLAPADEAFRIFQDVDDLPGAIQARLVHGAALLHRRRLDEGEALERTALAEARAAQIERLIAPATHNLGMARYFAGDFASSRTLFGEALTLYRKAGSDRMAGQATQMLAEAEFLAGNTAAAVELCDDIVELLGASGIWREVGVIRSNCSAYLVALARFEEARSCAREALVVTRELGFTVTVLYALQHLAAVAALRAGEAGAAPLPNLERAARLLGFVDARLAEARVYTRDYTDLQEYDKVVGVLRVELGAALDDLMREGQHWSEDRAVAEALVW